MLLFRPMAHHVNAFPGDGRYPSQFTYPETGYEEAETDGVFFALDPEIWDDVDGNPTEYLFRLRELGRVGPPMSAEPILLPHVPARLPMVERL